MFWGYMCYFFLVIDPADVGIEVNELQVQHQQALDQHYEREAEQGNN